MQDPGALESEAVEDLEKVFSGIAKVENHRSPARFRDFELGDQKWNTPEGDALVRELEKVIAKYPETPAGKEAAAMKAKTEAPFAAPAKGK